jgi:L-fucose isomerase-like protein
MKNLKAWIETGDIPHSTEHQVNAAQLTLPADATAFGKDLAADILRNKRIIGQLDPGCMGMLNAVIGPDKMAQIGMPLELLSQSDLLAEMKLVKDKEARTTLAWLKKKGANFHYGKNPKTDLVEAQVIEQMRMYHAAGRIVERYGLSAIGIPYQYGLVRSTSASDLVEGMLNNTDRPPIKSLETGKTIQAGKLIVHFNEGDVGSGVPQVLMRDILWRKKMPAETTLHDVRWGEEYDGRFVWVLLVSGGAAPAHFGGWKKTHIYRQPPMYFPLGGGTCSGVSKPGVITWARFYESYGRIGMDCGTGEVAGLPEKEVQRRLSLTNPEWPIANVYIPGYGRDELMATHQSNHITICYGDILKEFVATCLELGIPTKVVGAAAKSL